MSAVERGWWRDEAGEMERFAGELGVRSTVGTAGVGVRPGGSLGTAWEGAGMEVGVLDSSAG
jgi:hypothetical protein